MEQDEFFAYLQRLSGLPIVILDKTRTPVHRWPETGKAPEAGETLRAFLADRCGPSPTVFQKGKIHFAGFCRQGCVYVIGPCSFEPISFKERYEFGCFCAIRIGESDIPRSNYRTLKNTLLFLNYHVTGHSASEQEIWENYTLGNEKGKTDLEEDVRFRYHVKNHEGEKNHASYEREKFYYERITRGEKVSDYALRDTDTDVMERVGEMAQDARKQYECRELRAVVYGNGLEYL